MKAQNKVLLLILFLTFTAKAFSQSYSIDYYERSRMYNFLELWRGDIITLDSGNGKSYNFPEAIGFIGDNYQRFYIHYTSIIKDRTDPLKYQVTGKTRVKNTVCSFSGTITIVKSHVSETVDQYKHRQGELICDIDFKEDIAQKESGYFKARLVSRFYIDFKGKICYDTTNSQSDSFCNNQVTGTWTSYTSRQSKKCNWGEFRIPQSGQLDTGAGEFSVNPKYLKNGWQNYANVDSKNKSVAAKAREEEARKWWRPNL